MKPRAGLILALALGLLAAPLTAAAQQAGKVPRIGFLEAGAASVNRHFADAFRQGLKELGYVEGQSVSIEERWAEGRTERFPDLVADLLGHKVDVIVAASNFGAMAAKKTTTTVPIVFVGVTDPIGTGLVKSLARPGGNLTGFSLAFEEGFGGKWVELFKEAVPRVSHVGVLFGNTLSPANEGLWKQMEPAAATLGVKLKLYAARVRQASEFDGAFSEMRQDGATGLIVLTDPLTLRYRARILDLCAIHRLPAIYSFGEFARAGGLMAYGPSSREMFRRAATYVDKILRGANPADLPVELRPLRE